MPPQVPEDLDSSWDDDTMPRFELDDPMSESAFDRVTAVPELPSELFAKQVMSEQSDTSPPDPPPEPPEMGELPRLSSEPPGAMLRASAPSKGANVATERPGRNGGGLTGLELMDLSAGPVTARKPVPSPVGHDPRDPVLELDLGDVARSGPPPPVLMPSPPASARDRELTEMKDRYAMGDFTGALVVAEGLLQQNSDDIDAQRYAQSCRDVLTQMYSARLGALSQRVCVAVPGDQIRWLSLDHRAGFVLSLIDGSSTVEELLDISGMNRLDALRILYTLFDQRVITLG